MTGVIVRVVLLSLNQRHGKSIVLKDRNGPPVTPLYHIEGLPLEMQTQLSSLAHCAQD